MGWKPRRCEFSQSKDLVHEYESRKGDSVMITYLIVKITSNNGYLNIRVSLAVFVVKSYHVEDEW
jgi:hypothetical protein